jgi:hypothetical protein
MGFYSSGPKIKESDIKIDDLMRRFCPNPVFVLIDVRPDIEGIPTTAYMSVEEVESVRRGGRAPPPPPPEAPQITALALYRRSQARTSPLSAS